VLLRHDKLDLRLVGQTCLLLVVYAGAALLAEGCSVTNERTLHFDTDGENTTLVMKRSGKRYSTVTVYEGLAPRGSFSLLHTSLERPLLFLSGRRAKEMICVYDFDVGLHILVVDLGAPRGDSYARTGDLDVIIQHSDFHVKMGDQEDLEASIAAIKLASTRQLRRWSVPTATAGWISFFPRKQAILDRLDELARSRRGEGLPIIH